MPVVQLESHLIDCIAAGEVVERPAAAVKELVENALDAHASQITILSRAGGREYIRVIDNGCGMNQQDLVLAVERHTTSKLAHGDITRIHTLGFRGEALPSIGAVSRLHIVTRCSADSHGWEFSVEGGQKGVLKPVATPSGTSISVSDLFFATPARLKFLKSDRYEGQALADSVRRLAIARPDVRFSFSGDYATDFDVAGANCDRPDDVLQRLRILVADDFPENALFFSEVSHSEALKVYGFAGVGTYHRSTGASIYAAVNGRPVRDSMITQAIRRAYWDLLPAGRHPVVVLFLECDPEIVDVNVHPAKMDVRFRDSSRIHHRIGQALKNVLKRSYHQASTHTRERLISTVEKRQPPLEQRESLQRLGHKTASLQFVKPQTASVLNFAPRLSVPEPLICAEPNSQDRFTQIENKEEVFDPVPSACDARESPLGEPCAQVHDAYIIAQNHEGLVLVDQHAAHERLVYERLKRSYAARSLVRQSLLIPEVVELSPQEVNGLLEMALDLQACGLMLERFGDKAVLVQEIPALLVGCSIRDLIRDIVSLLEAEDQTAAVTDRTHAFFAKMACYGSIRSGRRMRLEEMDALLREMESTPFSGQCNHGRPTHITLTWADIERLFQRR
jgi:DNA mismatch repair protein MutL